MRTRSVSSARCGICGCADVELDEVAERTGLGLILAQCPRCDHRWTARLGLGPTLLAFPSARGEPAAPPWEVPDAA